MIFSQHFNTLKFYIFTTLLILTTTAIVGQTPPPCPPPPVANYTLTVSPNNTISAGTTVVFKVMDNGTGNFISDLCMNAEWFVNGVSVFIRPLGDGSTSTSYGYSTNLLLNNDVVTCSVVQTCGCIDKTIYPVDNSITMHVSGVLPIELRDFRGFTEGGINHIVWLTASEINNKGFQVERLNPNSKLWEVLSFVFAQDKAANYEFLDSHPLSINYYRLRQIDIDGREQLSKVISLSTTSEKSLKAYPSVTSHILKVDYATEKENVHFDIFNILGQSVQSGILTQVLDVSSLALGTYILKVGTEQIKFHKQ
jgi:Secretion system C-terminal sorting domain